MSDDRDDLRERTIETRTHGRYLVSPGSTPGSPILLGFPGYAETAEEEVRRLRAIPGIGSWNIVSVQGLHQFYRRRTNDVVASWMTRQNRELAISDNIEYVSRVVRSVSEEFSAGPATVEVMLSEFAIDPSPESLPVAAMYRRNSRRKRSHEFPPRFLAGGRVTNGIQQKSSPLMNNALALPECPYKS